MTTTNNTYDWQDMMSIMAQAAQAIRNVDTVLRRAWHMSNDEDEMQEISAKRNERHWIIREFDRYPVHPSVEAAIKLVRPDDWHLLLLEHPHISQGDRSKIAYTQNEAKGKRDIQTTTSVGKYLTRHFSLPDHTIRDLVSRYGSADTYKFVHTTAEMIYHLHKGPGSCMVWSENRNVRCDDGVNRHPYEAYNPKYGWHMAVRIAGDDTIGRALCMTSPTDGEKYFVRTYARPANNGGYSETDNGMENWLKEQGYTKHSSWDDGEKMSYYATSDHFLAPYLDGGDKHVRIAYEAGNPHGHVIIIDGEGEYICDQTGGVPTLEDDNYFDCEDCGDSSSDDDGHWVGYNDDTHVCESCYENDYVYGYGRNGRQYSFPSNDAVYVESQSEYYNDGYLDDNNIVCLESGGYEHIDEAVEIDGEWYCVDDDRICRTEDTDEYMLVDEGCWQCEQSCNWYTDSVDFVEVDGSKYHPDHAPEQDDDEDSDICVTLPPVATKPITILTMAMLNAVSLVEDYTIEAQSVRFSMTILMDGIKYFAHRDVPSLHIATHGIDRVRQDMRPLISNELIFMSTVNAANANKSTETI